MRNIIELNDFPKLSLLLKKGRLKHEPMPVAPTSKEDLQELEGDDGGYAPDRVRV